jgi:hypothetical protein
VFLEEKTGFYQMVLYIIFCIKVGDSYEELLVDHPWVLRRSWWISVDYVSDGACHRLTWESGVGVGEQFWGAVSGSAGAGVPVDR